MELAQEPFCSKPLQNSHDDEQEGGARLLLRDEGNTLQRRP